jgi:calcineurin-like phosphoesterase family protein
LIYVSSDLHFGHDKDFIYAARGFSSIDEMNAAIVDRFNSVVSPTDDLYLLGDTMLGDLENGISLLKQLNGKIHILWGNHCTNNRRKAIAECPNVVEVVGYATMLKYRKFHFYLSHYPTLTANNDDDKPLKQRVLCLAGHTHSKEKFEPCGSYNVAVDAHDCYPVSIDEIIEDFINRKAEKK